jgi:MoxR-like ATPase
MTYDQQSEELENKIKEQSNLVEKALGEMSKVVVGQKNVTTRLMMALIADGHVLLEGLPGLAKTTAIRTLSQAAKLSFSRIQFTPDLLPADVIGTQIFNPKTMDFQVKKGPIFANLILADEINRAPAKVQSALLESMEEKQVTIGNETFALERPFLVMATQNPIEQEGTYALPEAQMDRFLFKVKVGYGTQEEEQEVVSRAVSGNRPVVEPVIDAGNINAMKDLASQLHVSDKIRKYIVQLVFATRNPSDLGIRDMNGLIEVGASPRASINLEKAARAQALILGRAFVTPQDVKDVGLDVLRHRIIPSYEAEAEDITTDEIVTRIFDRVDVP